MIDNWTLPVYTPFFRLGETVALDKAYTFIDTEMTGAMGMTLEDAEILSRAIVNAGHGDHLEIGSLFGGTAILATKAKKLYGLRGIVYCIDDLEMVGENLILSNAEKFGVELVLHAGKSSPFPYPDRRFRTTLIDAGHDYGNVIADWHNARDHTDKYVIFHDYDPAHRGVVEAAKEAMQEWTPVYLAEHTLVLEKP